jgi:hypothetical protein
MRYPYGQLAIGQISCDSKIEVERTHACATDAVDIVFAVVWEIVVLGMAVNTGSTQSKGNTHDDISYILDVYNDEARTVITIR